MIQVEVHRATDGLPELINVDAIRGISRVPCSQRGAPFVPPAAETYVTLNGGRGGLYVIEQPGQVYRAIHEAREAARDLDHVLCATCWGLGNQCVCLLEAA